ncbi:yojH [Wigglesworthia glossinidia endosymbiont of Glossina brevipalpis]|uniref:Probable malate:quinone oxidoreductase n=1 Tax=Wigglesworthia glossinidia brevipalpis TaxID=36870 RepID=MQO_WIGBR|nr:RecName: Full=Probable malate:quinone oxidoreductase; AltName: Full=MQO; AltName: Full=Malate dehydrogenase [quinone] [Wigglesworthia glossinidia endosymbiont of Glossina brevipalpis]BAC24750.1 yojH [Wigglesworthia glossinidia endosymbiont of Glossina brevipalpis]
MNKKNHEDSNSFKKYSAIKENDSVDVVLIGSGIMSATLGIYLKLLEPNWIIHSYERLNKVGQESSNAWNNAGTGHSAFCELNYTSINKDGSINISKAIKVNESFEISKQLWAYLIKEKILVNSSSFINTVPHMSFVWGENNINFLKKRFFYLKQNALFKDMLYSENYDIIKKWAPLIMEGRSINEKVAATRMEIGTDVNFGEITKQIFYYLKNKSNFFLYLNHDVIDIIRNKDKTWCLKVVDNILKKTIKINSKYVFIGSGGGALKLLQKSKIEQSIGYAGFPVGGQFLVTKNKKLTNNHQAKVYGKSPIGAPPMSVPHIDTRIINGEKVLLFGPFATFSSKFLKNGSYFDLFSSLTKENIIPILQVGINNFNLVKYLINQLLKSKRGKFNDLCKYLPTAKMKDWSLITAGQRVQIIKKDIEKGGILEFGTEIINSKDCTLSALLGASPGASTSASTMLDLLKIMFYDKINKSEWKSKLNKIFISYNKKIHESYEYTLEIRNYTSKILSL